MMLVGNGFDIAALSLLKAKYRTDYQSFFFYLKSMNFNPNNMIFKKLDELRQEHEEKVRLGEVGYPNWSDFEARLQEFVSGPRFIDFDNLRQDLAEIQRHFSSFLDLVVSPELLNELDRRAQYNLWAYCTFGRFLADVDDTTHRCISLPQQSAHYDLFNFNIINFNYTFLLDNYLLRLPSSSGHPICTDLVSVGEDVHCEFVKEEVHAGVSAGGCQAGPRVGATDCTCG